MHGGRAIREVPPDERPRERLAMRGAAGLSAAELIALLWGSGSRGRSAVDLASDALARFEASKGWTAGVDGSISLLTVGADARITTQTAQQPIVGFVLTNSGLMANLSMSGSRFTRLEI